jgi:hypothetical protein
VTRRSGLFLSIWRARSIAGAVAAGLLAITLAPAQASAPQVRALNQDEVREAVLTGRLVRLDVILGAVRGPFEQQMIDVRALERQGAYLFEILMLEADGSILHLYYDGMTGALVAWTGVGAESGSERELFIATVFDRIAERDEAGKAPRKK